MPRTLHEMTPDERQAYRIWESYLNDRTRSAKEHALARQKMDELLWAGPNAQVLEMKCRLEALEAAVAGVREMVDAMRGTVDLLNEGMKTVLDFSILLTERHGAVELPGPYVESPADVCPCHDDAEEEDREDVTGTVIDVSELDPPCCEEHFWATQPDAPQVTCCEEPAPPAEGCCPDGCKEPEVVTRKRGRPKGSKNRPKPAPAAEPAPEVLDFSPPPVDLTPTPPAAEASFPDPLADLFQ